MIVHLRSHSYYSLLCGVSSPKQLVQAASKHNMPALGLSDCDTLTGAVEFYSASLEAGIQPILGLELKFDQPKSLQSFQHPHQSKMPHIGMLGFLAMNISGWRSLCRLSSARMADSQYITKGYLPFDLLAQENSGLICLLGGFRSPLTEWLRNQQERQALEYLERLSEIFDDRLYITIERHSDESKSLSQALIRLAGKMSLSIVAAQPIYYLDENQADLQRVVSAIRLNSQLEELPEDELAPKHAYFLPPSEMKVVYADLPKALERTLEIAARCKLELPLHRSHFPEIELPDGQSPSEALRQKAFTGAQKLYGALSDSMIQRLEHELKVIDEKNFSSLFLIMEEIIQFTRQADIPSASRGSASSSLVAHCLGITTPDPIRLNLYFERFLNPSRSNPPDIDTDLCSRRRDQVIEHIYTTYGVERVAMVGTINRFRSRSALREVAKAYGLPKNEINSMCNGLPYRPWIVSLVQNAQKQSPYSELETKFRTKTHQDIFKHSLALLKVPHHLSVHAGGLVIAPHHLTDLVPVTQASKGILITQFDLESIEQIGLVKLDLLGIRTLSVLGDVADSVRKNASEKSNLTRLEFLDAIPGEDPQTADSLRNGRTIGCFQIESPGMRSTLQEIQAQCIDDVMVALALYRPGPLSGGLKDAFVRRHLGKEVVSHLHPTLQNLLGDTYGVILYQEQVLRIAHELGGLNLAEADTLRRAMSHFDPGKQMQSLKQRFISGSAMRGVPLEPAERIWELMAAFAGYGFPKAHAASYAQVAWRSAWCKSHYPAEFMAAVLANWGGYYSQRVYIMECRRLGLPVHPPHINHSLTQFSVVYQDGQPHLYMGLDQVRDLTRRTQRNIIQKRPFQSLEDFLARVNPRPAEAENLVRAGAFQQMGSAPDLLERLKRTRPPTGQMALFSLTSQEVAAQSNEDWTIEQKALQQEAILGISVDVHPLELVSAQLANQNLSTISQVSQQVGSRIRLAGIRQTWQRIPGAAGDYRMTLEDLEGTIEVLIPARLYRLQRNTFTSRYPLIVEGRVELDPQNSEAMLRLEKVWRVD